MRTSPGGILAVPSPAKMLEAADFIVFCKGTAAALGTKFKISIASFTFFPRTNSTTRRTLRADIRTKRARETASITPHPFLLPLRPERKQPRAPAPLPPPPPLFPPPPGGGGPRPGRRGSRPRTPPGEGRRCRRFCRRLGKLAGMAAESPGGGEFPQLVADHILGYIDRDELVAVVHGKGEADELRREGTTPRPGFDNRFDIGLSQFFHLLKKLRLHERPFF